MKQETTKHYKVMTDFIWGLKGVIGLEKLGNEQVSAVKKRCLIKKQNSFYVVSFSCNQKSVYKSGKRGRIIKCNQ